MSGTGRPGAIAYAARAISITDRSDDVFLRVDSAEKAIDRVRVGRGAAGVVARDGGIWVADKLDGTVSEVDPDAGKVVATIRSERPDAIAFGYGSVSVRDVTGKRCPGSIQAVAASSPPSPSAALRLAWRPEHRESG